MSIVASWGFVVVKAPSFLCGWQTVVEKLNVVIFGCVALPRKFLVVLDEKQDKACDRYCYQITVAMVLF